MLNIPDIVNIFIMKNENNAHIDIQNRSSQLSNVCDKQIFKRNK